jgi:hypothetical protein
MKLTTHLKPVLRVGMSRAVSSFPHMSLWYAQAQTYFYLLYSNVKVPLQKLVTAAAIIQAHGILLCQIISLSAAGHCVVNNSRLWQIGL